MTVAMYDRDGDVPYDDPLPGGPPYGGRPYDRERPARYEVVGPPYNYRAVQVAWFVFAVIVALIALRFALKLLGASPQAAFVGFTYGITAPLVAPFRGIFPDTAQGFFVFEASSLVAMVIYLLLGWGVVALIKIVTAPRRRPNL